MEKKNMQSQKTKSVVQQFLQKEGFSVHNRPIQVYQDVGNPLTFSVDNPWLALSEYLLEQGFVTTAVNILVLSCHHQRCISCSLERRVHTRGYDYVTDPVPTHIVILPEEEIGQGESIVADSIKTLHGLIKNVIDPFNFEKNLVNNYTLSIFIPEKYRITRSETEKKWKPNLEDIQGILTNNILGAIQNYLSGKSDYMAVLDRQMQTVVDDEDAEGMKIILAQAMQSNKQMHRSIEILTDVLQKRTILFKTVHVFSTTFPQLLQKINYSMPWFAGIPLEERELLLIQLYTQLKTSLRSIVVKSLSKKFVGAAPPPDPQAKMKALSAQAQLIAMLQLQQKDAKKMSGGAKPKKTKKRLTTKSPVQQTSAAASQQIAPPPVVHPQPAPLQQQQQQGGQWTTVKKKSSVRGGKHGGSRRGGGVRVPSAGRGGSKGGDVRTIRSQASGGGGGGVRVPSVGRGGSTGGGVKAQQQYGVGPQVSGGVQQGSRLRAQAPVFNPSVMARFWYKYYNLRGDLGAKQRMRRAFIAASRAYTDRKKLQDDIQMMSDPRRWVIPKT